MIKEKQKGSPFNTISPISIGEAEAFDRDAWRSLRKREVLDLDIVKINLAIRLEYDKLLTKRGYIIYRTRIYSSFKKLNEIYSKEGFEIITNCSISNYPLIRLLEKQ